MALDNIGLNRVLGIFPRPLKERLAIVRADAKKAILKERKLSDGGGPDFYLPFWADAKEFFFGDGDLREAVKARVQANKSRQGLYPLLLARFLEWERTVDDDGYSKEPIGGAFGSCTKLVSDAAIRVYGVLAWADSRGESHLVYPYFSKDVPLTHRIARLGRWAMGEAMKEPRVDDMQLLDVLRARTFDNDNCALSGNECELFKERYVGLLAEWEAQKRLVRRS